MARKYRRDNKGRFAGGGGGATARGGRLKTASGNKRKTQTMQSSAAPKGTIGKSKRLKPQSARSLRTGIAVNRMRSINQKIGKGPDLAQTNIKGRFSGQAGKRMDASIDRAVKQTKSAQTDALMKPKAQVRAERAARAEANRAAQAAKPKRTRSVESLRASRAKQIEKRRSITTNPAGERDSAAAKMAANAARTQQRATAFYKAGAKPARAAAKPAVTKGARLGGTRRTTRAAAVANTAANRTGQSKTLNRFNSRPERTRGAYVGGRYVDKAKLTGRQALDLGRSDDQAFARTTTKAARSRAAAPAKAQQKQTTVQRATRAAANQKRVTQAVLAKASRRPTSKQRRSIMTAESAKRFYATKAVDYLKVNVKKSGFRLPRGMR